jgi:hypothetical protein
MASQMRPASKKEAPDPSDSYERSHPEHEAGMGELDVHLNTPTDAPDRTEQTVTHRQDGTRQVNAHEVVNERASATTQPKRKKPKGRG